MKAALFVGAKLIVLTIILFVCFALAGRVLGQVETASSNFILGVLIGWLLTNRLAFTKLAFVERAS